MWTRSAGCTFARVLIAGYFDVGWPEWTITLTLTCPAASGSSGTIQAAISILAVRMRTLIYPRTSAAAIFFPLHILQGPKTVSWVHIEVELMVSDLVLGAFLGYLSMLVLFLRQTCSVALAARQPVGTGRAQIRCNIAPKRRRVR
jgi:hypothetical protein